MASPCINVSRSTRFTVEGIPDTLKQRHQWICWKTDTRDGKTVRIPCNPYHTGDLRPVSVTDPQNIADFKTAVETAEEYEVDIGFSAATGSQGSA